MGLFGPGSSYSRLGGGTQGASAHKAIENIAGPLEAELRDTPGEYFVLQAAGMLFACEAGAVGGVQPVRSMEESLARARQIMSAFSDVTTTDAAVLKSKAVNVYDQLKGAAANGIPAALLVGYLNDYLHHVDNGYLKRKGPAMSPALPKPSGGTRTDNEDWAETQAKFNQLLGRQAPTPSTSQAPKRWWEFWK
jgi:hypothetical protein